MNTKPQIAIVTPNTLEALGLAAIVERMMPMAEACLSGDFPADAATGGYFHFFITSEVLLHHADFFAERAHKTIVLVHGDEPLPLQGFRTLNVCQPEEALVRDILAMASHGHRSAAIVPDAVRRNSEAAETETPLPALTPREREVIALVARGLLNKEIADRLNVGLTTVISHRKNLTAKLGIKSVGALTIYAVTHGLVRVEEI